MALYKENVTTPDANDKAVYGLRQITAKYNHVKDQLEIYPPVCPLSADMCRNAFSTPHETVAAGMPVVSVISEGTPEVEINLPAVEYPSPAVYPLLLHIRCISAAEIYADLISVTPKANANQLYTMRLQVKSGDKQAVPSPGMNTMVTIEYAEGGNA